MLQHLGGYRRVKRSPQVPMERMNYHHLLGWTANTAAADSNVAETAIADATFTRRNGSGTNTAWVFTEPWRLLWVTHFAASATRLRLDSAIWKGIATQNIWPLNRSATIASDHRIVDYRDQNIVLPMNDFIEALESNDLGMGNEQAFTLACIGPPNWNRNIPSGIPLGTVTPAIITARFTATISISANAWSADTSITFTDTLRTGSYAVVGCEVQAASLLAFRFNFPRMPYIQGRKLFPAALGTQTVGNQIPRLDRLWGGEWGRFSTLELPQIAALSLAGGGTSLIGWMDLVYLGERTEL